MRLLNITASPHPIGNRIVVRWDMPSNPPDPAFASVRVVRLECTYPTTPTPGSPSEGVIVPEVPGQNAVVDAGLQSGSVYYYSLFPFRTTGPGAPVFLSDMHNRAQAMATARMDMAGQMYALLPAIYHRYDTAVPSNPPPDMATEDKLRGQLRRFLNLPGSQLDQLYSFAQAILEACDTTRLDGRLLPLLALWIGWKTNYELDLNAQRNEIRNAVALYETTGILPIVQATVKRITRWESRTKEYVHNVFLSSQPERLNLWLRTRNTLDASGTWGSVPTSPLSINFAYEGRPAAAVNAHGRLWLFYHTSKQGRWQVWFKQTANGQDWTPSAPVPAVPRTAAARHPSAATQGNTLWLFWDVYDEGAQSWQIQYATVANDFWSSTEVLGAPGPQRRQPSAIADADGIWLFWLEQAANDTRWRLRFNRHNGTAWSLPTAASVPDAAVGVDDEVFVLFHRDSSKPRIWVFWVSQVPITDGNPGDTRAIIFFRSKASANVLLNDWGPIVNARGTTTGDFHDRSPAAIVLPDGNIELFFSSNRVNNYAVWRSTIVPLTRAVDDTAQVTAGPYAQRAPLAVPFQNTTLLIYRSNESLTYTSPVYGAGISTDLRYAGSTTLDTRDQVKLAKREKFDDFQHYTYDLGLGGRRTDADRYARDTVGVFVDAPGGLPSGEFEKRISRVRQVLDEFTPATDRVVFF